MSIGHLVSQSIFSLLCLGFSLIRLLFGLGLPSQDHSCSGSLRRVYQLNPTDFATSLTLLHSFSKSRKLGFGGNLLLLNSFLLCFHHFLDLTINGHISLLGMLGVPLSTVNL